MISRTFSNSSSAKPIEYSGIVGLLKPIKRLRSQIYDEATLLRRFTYKNKNQHKGTGWWRKIIESDRIMSRVLEELDGFLLELDENRGNGIIRFARCSLLIERSLEVLVASSSLLDLLILSRAFLPFSVTVVALISRLFVLSTILLEDLAKVSITLIRIVSETAEFASIQSQLSKLPKKLQQFLPDPLYTPNPNAITSILAATLPLSPLPSFLPSPSILEPDSISPRLLAFQTASIDRNSRKLASDRSGTEVKSTLGIRKNKNDRVEGKKPRSGAAADEIDDIFG